MLTEVSMSPSTLDEFLQSPAASGIYAGFEAEICFPIKVAAVPYKPCVSIDQIIDFFNTGPNNTNEVITNLENKLNAEFTKFKSKKPMATEADFFKAKSYTDMSKILTKFKLNWPASTEAFNYPEVVKLAMSLHKSLGVKAVAGHSPHSYTRDADTWILEPDETLEPPGTDIGVEVVTPPMPLATCIDKLSKFVNWAIANKAYAHDSTGFHVGVSLPNVGGNVDYVKLALFLQDERLLTEFDRNSNPYCKKAAAIITNHLTSFGKDQQRQLNIINATLDTLRSGLYSIAGHSVFKRNTGKYVAINMKDSYVEFRIVGGPTYLSDIKKLQNLILRYAYAMSIAGDSTAHTREYAKKMYKFLDSTMPAGNATASTIISQYMSGKTTLEDIKQIIATKNK